MIINFVGLFNQPGYIGEISDETHIARELEALGHKVRKIPRDEWREYVIEGYPKNKYRNVPEALYADINLIAKWHHFYDGSFIHALRKQSGAPVFYWVWDWMADGGIIDWHYQMATAADMYLGNDVHDEAYRKAPEINAYYFPFDCYDKEIPRIMKNDQPINVAFFGSWIGQGDRQEWLQMINQEYPVTAFTWNPEAWPKTFQTVNNAVYGDDLAKAIADCKIILGFNVNDHIWGYWSNRVGKVLGLGGFLLQRYVPGMELFLGDACEFFSTPGEAIFKINYYLEYESERKEIAQRGFYWGRDRFTSAARAKQLEVLINRFLKGAFL